MQLELGKIYEGKVTSIKEYGAFVEIVDQNVTGMVHISQISNEYVSNAKDYLSEGQVVKVKFIGTNDDGKIKLSIKEAIAPEFKKSNPQQKRNYNNNGNNNFNNNYRKNNNSNGNRNRYNNNNNNSNNNDFSSNSDDLFSKKSSSDNNFEDMLNRFKQRSDENLNDLKKITDRRNRTRRK